jgi:D-inositol-3-phosphate glycosyltransferase
MRIAMVSEHASPLAIPGGVDAGGQNVYVDSLARALATRGHDVDVYTRRDNPSLPERVELCPGVQVVHVPVGPPEPVAKDLLLQWMPDFGDWLARDWSMRAGRSGRSDRRPDVVHAHFWMSGVAAVRAARPLGRRDVGRIPVAQTFHALGSVKRRFQGAGDRSPHSRIATERKLAGTVDQVIATCADEVAELARMRSTPRDVRVVPCGVDLERFAPQGAQSLPAGLPTVRESEYRLLYVGRLVERKGIDTAVRALVRLPDCRLVVAGGPPAEDLPLDEEAVRLLALARDLGVADRLHLIGRIEQPKLPSLFRWADVVVATPWYEPFGIVPLEAMACGRPLVGSAVGGLLDTVVPGVSGVLVPPRDPVALADALRTLLDNPVAREAMGRAARRRALARYGWNRVAEEIESGYAAIAPAAHWLPAEAM